MAELRKDTCLMLDGHGFRARAHHLVGVAAAWMLSAVAPRATADTAGAPPRVPAQLGRRRCHHKWGNRRPGLYTPDTSGSAWIQNFNNGNQNNNNKDWSAQVRAVRK
jgi:hypothetical protein